MLTDIEVVGFIERSRALKDARRHLAEFSESPSIGSRQQRLAVRGASRPKRLSGPGLINFPNRFASPSTSLAWPFLTEPTFMPFSLRAVNWNAD
jgi:hypothetical protein